MTNQNLSGYPSIDKPWLRFYPCGFGDGNKQYNKVIDYIRDVWKDAESDTMIHYYGSDITAGSFLNRWRPLPEV